MTYDPISFWDFGAGLNLRDKEDAVSQGECVACIDVEFTERGAVKQRNGYGSFTPSALTNPVASLHPYYTTSGTKQLLAGCGTRLEAINTSGGIVASATGLTDGTWDFCRFGAPGSEVAYAGNGKNLLYKWNGTAWASVANSPKARYLAVMAVDQGNRLVVGGFDDSATGGPSASQSYTDRVWFSNPGAPETFGANNYISFTPGDGEKIQSVITWREFVFVFKETKFFVIYGSSTDSAGNPVFNYRTVDTGAGLSASRAVCVGLHGVYFMTRDGMYVTSGGDPEQISDLIDPIWTGVISNSFADVGGPLVLDHASIGNSALHFHNERIYLAFTTADNANDRMLVYDPRYGWWSYWSIPAACLTSFRIGSQPELVFGNSRGSACISRHSSAYTHDDLGGGPMEIASLWQSGWMDFGASTGKTIRETKVWGSGKVAFNVLRDFTQNAGDATLLDFTTGTGGRNGALSRKAAQGTTFSTYLSNNTLDQGWTVSRLTHHVRESLVPSRVAA